MPVSAENCVLAEVKRMGRDYVTPEDISAVIESGVPLVKVRLDTLECMGLKIGCEDIRLCAFVAWEGHGG